MKTAPATQLGIPVLLLALISIGLTDGSWSKNFNALFNSNIDFLKGSFTLSEESDKKREGLEKLMELMGFNPEEITSFQDSPTAGNFEIKVLDEKKRELEIITDTPNGKQSIFLNNDKKPRTVKLWNGKEVKGRIQAVEDLARVGKDVGNLDLHFTSEGKYSCTIRHRFNETDVKQELTCSMAKIFITYKAELYYKRDGVVKKKKATTTTTTEAPPVITEAPVGDEDYEDIDFDEIMDGVDDRKGRLIEPGPDASGPDVTYFLEGGWEVISNRKDKKLAKWMASMGYREKDIRLWQEHRKAGNLELKVLDNEKPLIGMRWYTPERLENIVVNKKAPKEGKTWDGRKYEEGIERVYNSTGEDSGDKHRSITLVLRRKIEDRFQCIIYIKFTEAIATAKYKKCKKFKPNGGKKVKDSMRSFKRLEEIEITFLRYTDRVYWPSEIV